MLIRPTWDFEDPLTLPGSVKHGHAKRADRHRGRPAACQGMVSWTARWLPVGGEALPTASPWLQPARRP